MRGVTVERVRTDKRGRPERLPAGAVLESQHGHSFNTPHSVVYDLTVTLGNLQDTTTGTLFVAFNQALRTSPKLPRLPAR